MSLGTLKREVWHLWGYARYRLSPSGVSSPPHIVKRRCVRAFASGRRVLVETGTYMGDMVAAQRRHFSTIHTIELSPQLAAQARKRFARVPNVAVHEGDSATVLREVMGRLAEPAVIWLDAHFSGGVTAGSDDRVPIFDELEVILGHPVKQHVVLIDDARLFDGTAGYPRIREIEEFVARSSDHYQFSVKHDIIHLIPAGA